MTLLLVFRSIDLVHVECISEKRSFGRPEEAELSLILSLPTEYVSGNLSIVGWAEAEYRLVLLHGVRSTEPLPKE